MQKIFYAILLSTFLSACAGPHFAGKAIDKELQQLDIVVVKDEKTREGFFETVTGWLRSHNYQYEVAPEHSKHDLNKLTLEYVGLWSWDLALYLRSAEIKAYNNGQHVGDVEFKAPNSLNTNKFGKGEERIEYMMDILFGEKTAEEATTLINQ